MERNKYGGINDMPNCPKRVYDLWYQMLRRCYDPIQQQRSRGKSYGKCDVSDRWKYLSNFAKDITYLDGYSEWQSKTGYCLDKDSVIPGNTVYCRSACKFIPYSENIRDISRRNPNVTRNAIESHKTVYILEKGNEVRVFASEKEACSFLGVAKCSVSSCFHKGYKCKGYAIKCAKMDAEPPKEGQTDE